MVGVYGEKNWRAAADREVAADHKVGGQTDGQAH